MTTIEASDLPDDVTVLREKIAAAIDMATDGGLIDVTLVEACAMGGLKYEKIADIAARCDLEPEQLNEMGLGVIDSPNDREYEEVGRTVFEHCGKCEKSVEMDMWRNTRGGWRIMGVECQNCGETGSRWTVGVGDPQFFGVLEG